MKRNKRERKKKRKNYMIEKNRVSIIQDNFLAEEEFVALRDILWGWSFPWFYQSGLDYISQETDPGFLRHAVFKDNVPASELFETHFFPILEALEFSIVSRIQINLNWRLPQSFTSTFHTDTSHEEQMTTGWTTSILYINTNNGYTELENGDRIESVANRLVSFPTNIMHRACTQTDTQRRILINFNYLKEAE